MNIPFHHENLSLVTRRSPALVNVWPRETNCRHVCIHTLNIIQYMYMYMYVYMYMWAVLVYISMHVHVQ